MPRGVPYSYYLCGVPGGRLDYARECGQGTSFPAGQVDATVWGWVRDLFLDPEATLAGMRHEQAGREAACKPLGDRLAVIDDLISGNRRQLERVLDLYLAGDFPSELLTERKERLQVAVDALTRERVDLEEQIEAQAITDEQIETVMEFGQEIGQGLEAADKDFRKRRRLIEELDLRARLAIENGEPVVYVKCKVGEGLLSLVQTNT